MFEPQHQALAVELHLCILGSAMVSCAEELQQSKIIASLDLATCWEGKLKLIT